jgi:hypothetical protein
VPVVRGINDGRQKQLHLGGVLAMAVPQRRDQMTTIRELLTSQRQTVAPRCTHCARDSVDRDHELVQAALQKRIRLLEMKLHELEATLAGADA